MPESSPPVSAVHALGVYAEALANGRRVVVVGDASDGLGQRLASLGARAVHVYDPDETRAASVAAARGVSVRALPQGDLDVRDGAFDLAIVPDLAAVPDPAALLARVRRLVGAEGAAIVAARNPEARGEDGAPSASTERGQKGAARSLDYYELYDLVALQFANVRMIGQVPFRGVALAELGEGDGAPQVSVDTQLVPEADAPEVFIALAGQRDVRLDPYAIVQLPAEATALPARVDTGATAALAEAQLRAELLHAQLEEQRAKLRDVESRAADTHVRAERLVHDQRALEEDLQRQRERAVRLARELEEEKKVRTKFEIELGMVRKSPELAASRGRVSELEEALRAAEVVVSALQSRVAELEAHTSNDAAALEQVPNLVAELEATRAMALAGELATRELAGVAARAVSAERRAASLEAELAQHADSDATGEELGRLEAALLERAQAVQTLEHEVHRRERIVHELLAALEEARDRTALHEPAQVPAEGPITGEQLDALHRKLDALATELARREGDAQASAWRIAELEQEVAALRAAEPPGITSATVPPPPGAVPAGDLERQLAAAHDLIDVLKQALAQEHEDRKKSESSDALARARAELERQAALIEQLSRELEARDRAGVPHAPLP